MSLRIPPALPGLLSRCAFDALRTRVGRSAAILWEEARWRAWRQRHPGRTFGDYYVERISRNLDHGLPHRTLGPLRWSESHLTGASAPWSREEFAARGRRYLDELVALGLATHHRVVDYGCGSLRIGQHLIRFLEAGRYCGLDLTDRFFRDGLAFLEPGLCALKRPRLQVIDEERLRRTAAEEPDFVISVAVMKHVPPPELLAYWRRLSQLAGPSARIVVTCELTERGERTSSKSWGYSEREIRAAVESVRPGARIALARRSRMRPGWWRGRVTVEGGAPAPSAPGREASSGCDRRAASRDRTE